MAEKTPRELFHERLERNAEKLGRLPGPVRSAISTESIFSVPSRREQEAQLSAPSSVTEPPSGR